MQIENLEATEDAFYVLANRKEEKIGYFLMKVDMNNPEAKHEYLIHW
jgi:hypothetical protein